MTDVPADIVARLERAIRALKEEAGDDTSLRIKLIIEMLESARTDLLERSPDHHS